MKETLREKAEKLKNALTRDHWHLVDALLEAAEKYEASSAGVNTKSGVYATRTDKEIE
jgi:hypothetical protein